MWVLALFPIKEWVLKPFYLRQMHYTLVTNTLGQQLLQLHFYRMFKCKYKTWRFIWNPDMPIQLSVRPMWPSTKQPTIFFSMLIFWATCIKIFQPLTLETKNTTWNVSHSNSVDIITLTLLVNCQPVNANFAVSLVSSINTDAWNKIHEHMEGGEGGLKLATINK